MISKLKTYRLTCDGYLRPAVSEGLYGIEPCTTEFEATAFDRAEFWEKAQRAGWTADFDGSHYCHPRKGHV